MAERKKILVVAETQAQARPHNIELGYGGYAYASVTDAGNAVAVIERAGPEEVGGVLVLGVYIPYSGLADAEVERLGAQRVGRENIGALAVVEAAEKKGLPMLIEDLGTPEAIKTILKRKSNVSLLKFNKLDDLSPAYRAVFQ